MDMMDGASIRGMAVGCGQARWLADLYGRGGVELALVCVWRCGLRGGIYLDVLAGWGEKNGWAWV